MRTDSLPRAPLTRFLSGVYWRTTPLIYRTIDFGRPAHPPTSSMGGPQAGDGFESLIPEAADGYTEKPTLLCLVPWFNWGGAEAVLLHVLEGLAGRYRFIAVATEPGAHNADAIFARWTAARYRLGGLIVPKQAEALERIFRAHGVHGMLISWSPEAYRALPALDTKGLWVGDIIHNTVAEGHLRLALEQDARINAHFAVGRHQLEALVRGGVERAKIRLAPNGVDVDGQLDPARYREQRAALRGTHGFADEDLVACWVGRLSAEKDPLLFVRSLARVCCEAPEARLKGLIIGDGPLEGALRQEISALRLDDRVVMLGYRENVAEIFAAADALILTSRIEGSPTVVAEAMSMALPIVASDLEGVRDVVEDGVHGFIAARRTPGAFAVCLRQLLAHSDRGAALGAAGRQRAVAELSLTKMIEVYSETIEAALGNSV